MNVPPSRPASPRRLLGPGPSMVHPRVYAALGRPLVGHLDPLFLGLMDETQAMLRQVFRTKNPITLSISGTGTAGMAAALVNLVEPRDEVLVLVNGVFGARMEEMVHRLGGVAHRLERPWGEVFSAEEVAEALERWPDAGMVAVVHAETSTGAHQPLEALGRLCRESGRLLLVDAVTSLGGAPVEVDAWQIDACYSGTQKCLSCPPGLAPLTVGPRAWAKIRSRRTEVASWYLDLRLIADYWAEERRAYHHTAPISMNYALHEALRLVLEEGLEARFARHRLHSRALMAGLGALGFEPFAVHGHRLPMLNAVRLPPWIDDAATRRLLLERHNLEVGGGLGALAGRVWRVGLMGESCHRVHVDALLEALAEILRDCPEVDAEAGLHAADTVYRQAVGGEGALPDREPG